MIAPSPILKGVQMSPKDGRRPAWRPELMDVPGVDGDPWRALILQQLCYWASRTKDGDGWVHKTAEEMHAEIGAGDHLTVRAVRRKLVELEGAAVESREGWQRRKSYRVDRDLDLVESAVQASRGPSSIVHSDADVRRTDASVRMRRTPASDERTPASDERTPASDARTESTVESTVESCSAARGPVGKNKTELDDDEKLLVAFVGVGMHSAHLGQCGQLLAVANSTGVPDPVTYISERIAETGPRCRGGAAQLTKWIINDIKDGKWREHAIKAGHFVPDAGESPKPRTREEEDEIQARIRQAAREGGW